MIEIFLLRRLELNGLKVYEHTNSKINICCDIYYQSQRIHSITCVIADTINQNWIFFIESNVVLDNNKTCNRIVFYSYILFIYNLYTQIY